MNIYFPTIRVFRACFVSLALTHCASAGLTSDQPVRSPYFENIPRDALASSPFEIGGGNRAKITAEMQKIDRWFQAGDEKRAEVALRDLAKSYPIEPAPLVGLARMYYSRKKFTESRSALEEALKRQDSVSLRLDLAAVHAEGLDNPAAAMEHVTRAIEIEATHAGAHYALGRLYQRLGDNANAATAFSRSVQLDARQSISRRALAESLIQQRKFVEAAAQLQEATELAPNDSSLRLELGDILQVLADTDAALAAYEKATKLSPENAFVWAKLGMQHQAMNKLARADENYAQALRLDSSLAIALNNRAALALEGQGSLTEALGWARLAILAEPKNPYYLDTLAQLQLRAGSSTEAIATLRSAIAANPNLAFLRLRLAEALGSTRDGKKEALAILANVPAESPEHPAAMKLRSQIDAR